MASQETEETRQILSRTALSFPSPRVVHDLLSVGVCPRCIFRLFGVHGQAYCCSAITASVLQSFLEEQKSCDNGTAKNGLVSDGLVRCSYTSQESENGQAYCCICLGVLQLACEQDQEMMTTSKDGSIDDFTATIAELVKRENHHIDGFSIEVSIPPVIVANERAIWMYMNKKYKCEEWFKDKIPSQHISVKDALRLSINTSLENHLGVKSGVDSFRFRLNYSHLDASRMLQSSLANDRTCKKQKTDKKDSGDSLDDSHKSNLKNSNEHLRSESDAVILRTLESMLDHAFCEHFVIPPEKALKPCQLTTTCYRMPIYIGGRYLKFSRKVSQSRWIIDDERMGEASVEEIVGSNALLVCKGDNYKFHAAGREDIDVRMLGSGRPFLVEVSNARYMPSMIDVQLIVEKINNSDKKYVRVRNLKVVNSQAWTLMREGEAEKQKQYAALVWISRALTEEDLHNISSRKDLDIIQRTPIRVLHRRSPLERKKIIHWMKIERIAGSCQYFLLHLCTQAGTYIKEFVHGDLGRTHPSIGAILGCRAEILQLDVTDVKMDFFD
ncbi:uncharacterized protein [Elaeis guineensis]|uniref:tRNA pseudouridine(55) synthase n=1 Tax=Elaeis guineensis var. tenera TaxID=51953 RepID=A0A6I9R5P7_ELAGV|nr:putative tRNA pseudouridine synthase Pus10 isoform X2 [Elaeis guineensis]